MHLLGQRRRLLGDGDAFEIDAGAAVRGAAQLHQVAGQPVGEVDHGRGHDLLVGQRCDDVGAGAGFEVFFEKIFVAGELRFGVGDAGQHAFLAFEQLQPHVCGAEVAGDADQVVLPGPVAEGDAVVVDAADRRDGDDQPGHGCARVAADQVDAVFVAGEGDPFVEVLERFDGDFGRDAERDQQLRRLGVHGQNVAHGGRYNLIAQVLEREIGEVEVDAFEERIGRNHGPPALLVAQHSGVVARAPERRGVAGYETGRELVDKTEFAQFGYFGTFFLRCHSLKFLQN